MRLVALLCLISMLTACTAVGQAMEERGRPAAAAVQPAAIPALEAGVPLLLLNASQQRYEVHAADPATGQDAPGYAPIALGGSQYAPVHAFSVDGRQLALFEGRGESCEPYAGGTSCRGSADTLHLIDVQAWREVTATVSSAGWVWPLSFSPDATRLAAVFNEPESRTLALMDASTGRVAARQALDLLPALMEYTPDGSTLLVYGTPLGPDAGMTQPDPPRVLLVDATTLEVTWEQELAGVVSGHWCLEDCTSSHEMQVFASWTPAVVPSQDRSKLYIVHADEEKLTTVDLLARTLDTLEIEKAQSGLERLLALTASVAQAKGAVNGAIKDAVLSLDGTRLYVVGRSMNATHDAHEGWQFTETALGLQVIDLESGRRVSSRESVATEIKIGRDGEHLYLDGWGEHGQWATEILDANTLEQVGRRAGWQVAAIRQLDGRPVILASQSNEYRTDFALLDARSMDFIHSWRVNGYATWLAAPYLVGGPG